MYQRITSSLMFVVPLAAALQVVSAPAYAHFVPSPCDFITSGGFVFLDTGGKGTFGMHGGCKKGDFWGHINYIDHDTGLHVNSTEITGYLIDPAFPNARDICGWARTNRDEGLVRFRVRLEDNGEPGRDDRMGIQLLSGYQVTPRTLGDEGGGGGNVQLHNPNPSTKGPNPAPTEYEMCDDLRAAE